MFMLIVSEFLLFSAFVLLLIASLSAPIIDPVGFLNVRPNNLVYRFGAWGYCQTKGSNQCSGSSVGYDLTNQLVQIASNAQVHNSLSNATKANILLPIACGLAFLATLIAWMSKKLGFFLASFVSLLAFIVSLVAMIIQFAIYGLAKNDMKDAGINADYGSAMWMVLGATIALFIASITALFQCCCGDRRVRRREKV